MCLTKHILSRLIVLISRKMAPLSGETSLSPPSVCAEDNQPYQSLPCSDCKITSAVWGPLGEFVIAGHENGEINQFSAKVGRTGCRVLH